MLRFVGIIPNGKLKGRKISHVGELYMANKEGFVRQTKRSGLFAVEVTKDGERIYEFIHILVARTFIPIEKELPYVLHKDGNLENNCYTNLVWSESPDLDPDEFKEIPGFSLYKVSKAGVLKSYQFNSPRILKQSVHEDGYLFNSLISDEGPKFKMYLQCAVALTYLPNPDNLPTVDHIDQDKTNNRLENLRWASRKTQAQNRDTTNFFKKGIQRYNMEGNFLDEFESVGAAIEELKLKVSPDSIRRSAKLNKDELKTPSAGFMWRYSNREDKYILQEGEIAVKVVGTFDKLILDHPSYSITNFGNLINERGYQVKPTKPKCPVFSLQKGTTSKTRILAHVLVALFFVEGRSELNSEVDHLDEDRTNPRWDNLEWVTHAENVRRSAHNNHKAVNKIDIKTGEIVETFESVKAAMKSTGLTNISHCLTGRNKTAGGFIWKEVE